MAKAIMCDRCGACFDPKKIDRASPYIHVCAGYVIASEDAEKGKFTKRFEDYDFCPDCAEWLETWITVNDNS